MIARPIALLLAAGVTMACAGSRGGAGQSGGSGATVTRRSIEAVLAAHRDSLMALPGVVGTAIGLCDGERCIKVMLSDSNPDTRGRIPARLEGYRVVAEVTGTIRPRGAG
ncbi:MAG TPA: hypothetical protein VMH88_12580 [Gemmatimonadales bacterium]|nr:hypothetical protein [Gemmatimonadales bacterium]